MRRRGTFSLTEVEENGWGESKLGAEEWQETKLSPIDRDKAFVEKVSSSLKKKAVLFADEEDSRTMDIMMLLDIDKVPAIRDEFEANEEGLTQTEFVYVMMKYLKRDSIDETQLVSNLCELFAQIDVNGDGTMEWDEFTSFIVETGNTGRENEPNSIQQYYPSDFFDDAKHVGTISRCYHFPGINRIATCEENANFVNLFHPHTLALDRILRHKGGNVLCATHLPKPNLFAISSSDLKISLYDEQNHRLVREFQSETSQNCFAWTDETSTLFSAGVSGVIHAWDIENGAEAYTMGGVIHDGGYYLVNNSHTDMVLDLLQIDSLESLASASMDRTIKLWDVQTGKHKKTLEGHIKGVRSLAYSPEYRFMVSAGFDFDAYVWNPYVEHLILRLHGHNAPLCKVEMVPETPQIITADTSGVFKVWDIRNFGCVQTFSVETSDLRDFACAMHKSIVAVGRRMQKFDYEKLQNPELTDDHPIFRSIFNSTTMTILTATGRDIKLWDARKGTMMNRFRGLNHSGELSAVCLDDRERKFITGDHHGHIRVYDYMNGSLMKEFAYPERAHASEVSALLYCNKYKIVISSGWDDTILLHDEVDPEKGVLLRKLQGGHCGSDITALAYSQKLSLIASGSPSLDSPIALWDFEFGRLEAVLSPEISSLVGQSDEEAGRRSFRLQAQTTRNISKSVTALVFLDQHFPGLVSADDGGGIVIWAIRPAKELRNKALVRLVNHAEGQNAAVSVICVDQSQARLYTADEKGYVKVWDYSGLLEKVIPMIGGVHFKPVACENPRRKIHTDLNLLLKSETKDRFTATPSDPETKTPEPKHHSQSYTAFRASSVVTLERSWSAHSDVIQSMQLVLDGDRSCVLTAGHDCIVRIFSLTGKSLGILRQGEELTGLNWKFDIDVDSRRVQQLKRANNILQEVMDLSEETLALGSSREEKDDSAQLVESRLLSPRPTVSFNRSSFRLATTDASSQAYQRKTPRLAPIDPKTAGKGMSISLRGKAMRSRKYASITKK